MPKTVYQFDDNGYFLYTTEADESPLEPGVFLYPKNTTDIIPPKCNEHQIARWSGKGWLVESIKQPHPADTLVEFFCSYPNVYDYVVNKVEEKSKKHK